MTYVVSDEERHGVRQRKRVEMRVKCEAGQCGRECATYVSKGTNQRQKMHLVVDHRLTVRRYKVALVAAVRLLISVHTLDVSSQRVRVRALEIALCACKRLLIRVLRSFVGLDACSL